MIRKDRGNESIPRNRAGVGTLGIECREDERPPPFQRGGIEARLGDGEPQQTERLVAPGAESPQGDQELVVAGLEGQADRPALEDGLECLIRQIAGTLVEHRRQERRNALLPGRILGAAAIEGDRHGDDRQAWSSTSHALMPPGLVTSLI